MITLHEHDVKNVTNLGFGSVKDYISVSVTEELNGTFELEMVYHISGTRYNEFKLRRQLNAKPNPFDKPQLFRIYEITKPIDGLVTIYAEHISYDMNGIPVDEFTSSKLSESVSKIKSCSVVDNPFTIEYDNDSNGGIDTEFVKSMRSILGNNFRKSYKKDYKFDNYTVTMLTKRGIDRGVSIRYGKNLTSLEQDENCSEMVTGVYPYWLGQDVETEKKVLKKLPEKIVKVDGDFNFTKVIPYDVSEKYMNEPTDEEMRSATKSYIKDNKLDQPKVSLDVSFIQLTKSGEYKTKEALERVELGDTVHIEFPDLGVSSTARCIRTIYDPGTDEYIEISLGDAKSNLSSSISDSNSIIQDQITNQGIKFEATIGTIKIAMADIEYAMIDKADIKDLQVTNANIEVLNAKTANIETAIIGVAYVSDLNAINANITNLTADIATVQQLVATKADIEVLNAAIANIGTLTADVGYVKNLVSGNISSGNIQTGGITGSNLNMDTIFVKDANMINVNIGALKAGDISTNKFRIVSDDGGIEIAGATQQFKDKNNKVRLQLGKDSKGDFNFILLGEDGTSTLIDHTGVKPGAIADGLIVNEMIGDGEIGGKKIDISSMINSVNENGDSLISGSKILIDTKGQTLDIAFTSISNETIQNKEEIDNINSNKMYRVEIISSNGNIFKNGNIRTTLSARLYSWDKNITDQTDASRFIWTRTSNDKEGDEAWNTSNFGGTKEIEITEADVQSRATFKVSVMDETGNFIA